MRIPVRLGLAGLLMGWTLSAQAEPRWLLGIVPQFPAQEIQRQWQPVATWLSQACGVSIELDIPPSIPAFELRFSQGHYELAYMNPYHVVMARKRQGYVPLVREGQRMLSGVLVARKDGPVKSVSDLNGQTIAFPAPNAFGASLYLRALLQKEFGIGFDAAYVRTHSNSYRHVIAGDAMAAGGIDATLQREPDHVRDALAVIYRTPDVAPHALSAHPRTGADQRACVASTLTQATKDTQRARLMAEVQMPAPISADYLRDYQPLERLQLERFVID